MALINCPSCKTRISDKAKTCSQCGYSMSSGTTTDGLTQDQLQSKQKLARIKLRYSLQMQAMMGIILFLLGIVSWYFLGEKGLTEVSHFVELGTAFIGFVWYIITRVRLLAFKKPS